MNFDDLVNDLLDRYVVSEVNRNPFTAEEAEEDEDCDEGCDEDNEEPAKKKTFAAKWTGKFKLPDDDKDERSNHILKKDKRKDDSELSDKDTVEDE